MAINPTRHFALRNRRPSVEPTKPQLENIVQYLANPISGGIWVLEARWLTLNSLSKEIQQKVDKIDSIKAGEAEPAISLNKRDKEDLKNRAESFDFVLKLLNHLATPDGERTSFREYLEIDPLTKLLFDQIDFDELRERYAEAIEYYRSALITEGEQLQGVSSKFKNGYILMPASMNVGSRGSDRDNSPKGWDLTFVSLEGVVLEDLLGLFKILGGLDESVRVIRVFSPEDDLVKPYIDYLNIAVDDVMSRKNDNRLTNKAIAHFEEANFESAISSLSFIAEDYLIQIYETVARQKAVMKKTIGQRLGEIDNFTQAVLKGDVRSTQSPKQAKVTLIQSAKEHQINGFAEVIEYIFGQLKGIQEQISYIPRKNDDNSKSIMPQRIREQFAELIRYRNAASHPSDIVLGRQEAIRSFYYVISINRWWTQIKQEIDWSGSKSEVVKQLNGLAKIGNESE